MTEEPIWRTSSYTQYDSCVEVADNVPAVVMVRDSKARWCGNVIFQSSAWADFVEFSKALDS